MLSQQAKTYLVTGLAIYLGYWYSSSTTDTTAPSTSPSGTPFVTLEQLDSIRFSAPKMDRKLKAFVLGATGAVGKELVKVLAEDTRFDKVTLIGRRPVPLDPSTTPGHQKFENQIVDFEKLEESKQVFAGYDVGFSTLGTTRRKSGAAGFYRVDHDYVVESAKLAKEGGCQHLHLVSSGGANKNSYFLYMKTKGEVEHELAQMDFPRLSIYRPGVLLVPGGREDSRLVEAVLQGVFRPIDRMRWFSTDVPTLAQIIVANCFREGADKSEILENSALNKFAKQLEGGNIKVEQASEAGPKS